MRLDSFWEMLILQACSRFHCSNPFGGLYQDWTVQRVHLVVYGTYLQVFVIRVQCGACTKEQIRQ